MAWTSVLTVAVGDAMTAALWNTYLRDNLNFLASSGQMRPTGASHAFGTGANGGTGTYVNLGDFSDASQVFVKGAGSPTNVNAWVQGKGTGVSGLLSGNGNSGVTVANAGSTAGLGFYTATPVAKLVVTGAKGGNAALTSLLIQLDTLGLITNSST